MKTLLSLSFFFIITVNAFSQTVSLDPTFGSNGKLIIPSADTSEITAMDVDQNGNIYTAGSTSAGTGTGIYKLTVSKAGPNGVLDTQFGVNGTATVSFETSEYPLDIKVLPDSKILVSGSAYTGHTPTGPGLHIGFVARLNANGSPDTGFAANGVFVIQGLDGEFTTIHPVDDQGILVSGNVDYQAVFLKLNNDGTPDPLFGNSGLKYLSAPGFNFILWNSIATANDEFISVGYDYTDMNNSKIAYCRTDMQGNLVSSFGTGGIVLIDLYNSLPSIYEMLTTIKKGPNNTYYLGGSSMSQIIMRINEDGSADPGFGSGGMLLHSYPFKDLAVQDDGKVLIGGSKVMSAYNAGFSIIRLLSNGNVDTTFNNGTGFDVDHSANNDYLQTFTSLGPNAILVGGSAFDSGAAKSTLTKLVVNGALGIKDLTGPENIYFYPNPFTDVIMVSGETQLKKATLHNAAGRIAHSELHDNKILVQGMIPRGIYFVTVELENGQRITKKMIRK